ncbi:MAG: Rab family GTPase [Thermoplasmata archaeon]
MQTKNVIKSVIMLGDAAVGKTSLVRRFVVDQFDDAYITTLGAKPMEKDIRLVGKEAIVELRMIIWDIMGQKDYERVHRDMFEGINGGILVCDVTKPETLKNLGEYWIPTFFEYAGKVPLVLLANKVDLKDQIKINIKEIQALLASFQMKDGSTPPFYLTSAKTGENVQVGFEKLGELLLKDMGLL